MFFLYHGEELTSMTCDKNVCTGICRCERCQLFVCLLRNLVCYFRFVFGMISNKGLYPKSDNVGLRFWYCLRGKKGLGGCLFGWGFFVLLTVAYRQGTSVVEYCTCSLCRCRLLYLLALFSLCILYVNEGISLCTGRNVFGSEFELCTSFNICVR